MAVARPRKADPARTYDAIVDAARALLFSEEGVSPDVSMRRVAAAAGVSQGTLSYYFPTKQDLLEACLDEYYARLAKLVDELSSHAASGPCDARALVARAVRELHRLELARRRELRLRRITNAERGGLHPQHPRFHLLGRHLDRCARVFAEATGRSPAATRLAIHSVTTLVSEYVTLSDEEIGEIVGDAGDASRRTVEEHVVRAAVAIALSG
jgi:AcrR family transcriptional regulator